MAGTFFKFGALIEGLTSTATAGADTTLTASSQTNQQFTGTTTQNVILPDATTLAVGRRFSIFNRSTGTLTIKYNDGTTLTTVDGGNSLHIRAVTIGTTNGTFDLDTGGGTSGAETSALGVNYLTGDDVDAEGGAATATGYDDAAATPVDLTGGSCSATMTRTTTNPLRGSGSHLLTAGTQGEGFAWTITPDRADIIAGAVMEISLDGEYSATSAEGDYTVWVYDVANSSLIQPAPYKLPGCVTGGAFKWAGSFQLATNTTTLRVAIHQAVSSPGGNLKFDRFSIGPVDRAYGTIVTPWVAYTPTGTWTTNATYYGSYRRVGDSMEIAVRVVLGGAPTGTFSINIPNNQNLAFTGKWASLLSTGQGLGGSVDVYDASTNNRYVGVIVYNATVTSFGAAVHGTTAVMSATVPVTFAVNDEVFVNAMIPIENWAVDTELSSAGDSRNVVCVLNGSSTSITSSGATIVPTTTTNDTHTAHSAGTYTIPVPGFYQLNAFMQTASAAYTAGDSVSVRAFKNGSQLGSSIGALRIARTATDSYLVQGSAVWYFNAGDTINFKGFSTVTGNLQDFQGSIIRSPGPAILAAPQSVGCRYTNSAGTTLTKSASNTVPFATKDYDTHGAFVTDTFTAPMSGKYHVTSNVTIATGATWAANDAVSMEILKNGSSHTSASAVPFFGAQTAAITAQIAGTVSLLEGETIKINCIPTKASGGNLTLYSGSATYNTIAIERVGN